MNPLPRTTYRQGVGSLFFLQGLCFATWASRIPSIQQKLSLSEADLGFALLALPAGLMVSLPLAGWLVARAGSARVVVGALFFYGLVLTGLGQARSLAQLAAGLFVFGFAGNMVNIAVNTQGVGVEVLYQRSIMASFHGMWSLAGFAAAAVGTVVMGAGVVPAQHFLVVMLGVWAVTAFCSRFTLKEEARAAGGGRIFAVPDKSLLALGIIAFCCMMCEGAMFDWSGVYFQQVVRAEPAWVGTGYATFMASMATGRFIADWLTLKLGLTRVFQLSGGLIAMGLLLAVGIPQLPTALIGFLLVGFGVSSVVPLVYGAAGRSRTMPAGVALAAVSTIGFMGFLIGPPVIGLLASISSLRLSFTLIAGMGLCVALLATAKRFDAP
ncbi:MFS transporter [Stigmatella sp. ncwal1]|uniref:MFS transporter n=1 Tax=Stigmatella ashevillensis TaxID=2995309 RepID=A0ABT5DEH8_9BACT|nr:MFS transporter [Stigmatella ashevillena]MDC0712028.1 MFS transporter [Stigmatella ashevillena]